MSFAYFAHIPHSSKFTRGSSLPVEKYLLMEISKAEESSWLKKNLKNNNNNNKQALRGKKEYHSFKRRRRTSVKATAAGEAPRWLPGFEQRSHFQTKSITHRVKKKAPIIHASTGLDRKHQQSPQIVI